MESPILIVNNLVTQLKIGDSTFKVVEDVSFKLYPGRTLAIVGESGCGKSLTALSIMGIVPTPPVLHPQGEIIYQNRNLLTLPEKEMRKIRGARIAMIFQDPSSALNPVYTVGEQLIEVAELHLGLYGEEAVERAITALTEVSIQNPRQRMNEYPHQLSGGMKQRVMIAMALMCEPDILIADEPTTALDVTIQAQILNLIKALQKRMGMALLLITHDLGIVAEMADDVIVMYAAQTVEKGSVYDIFDHMAHPYTMGLFQSRPTSGSHKGLLKPIKGNVPPLTHFPKGCRFHPRCPYVMPKCLHGNIPDFPVQGNAQHISKCLLHDGTEESLKRWQEVSEHA